MIKAIASEWKWRTTPDKSPEGVPNAVTSGFAVDPHGFFPIIYRGPNVRSAKNCWSLPSGLHECGLTMPQQLEIELAEELGLTADHTKAIPVGMYENIAPQDQWHWVIGVYVIPVLTLDTLLNKEPDKHPEIRKVHISHIGTPDFNKLPWAPGLGNFLKDRSGMIKIALDHFHEVSSIR